MKQAFSEKERDEREIRNAKNVIAQNYERDFRCD